MLKNHPDGEFICDYLENDAYIPGHFMVPEMYNAKYKEQYRVQKYEYYLRRGLPIPQEYMPKDERDLLEKRRLYNDLVLRRGDGSAATEATEPQFNVALGPPTRTTNPAGRQRRRKRSP